MLYYKLCCAFSGFCHNLLSNFLAQFIIELVYLNLICLFCIFYLLQYKRRSTALFVRATLRSSIRSGHKIYQIKSLKTFFSCLLTPVNLKYTNNYLIFHLSTQSGEYLFFLKLIYISLLYSSWQ